MFSKIPIILLLVLSLKCFGQPSNNLIQNNWQTLKEQVQGRSKIVNNLVRALSKSKVVDKRQLSNSKTFAEDLFNYIDTLSYRNSSSMKLVSIKNDKLLKALSWTLVTLENDPEFKAKPEVREFISQLQAIENKIAVSKREYNKICKESKRLDLSFGKELIDK